MTSRSPAHIRERLLRRYPDYCTAVDVARAVGVSLRTVPRLKDRIKWIDIVDDSGVRMTLYDRHSAMQYAANHAAQHNRQEKITLKGLRAQRMREICVIFYKTQQDRASSELLSLAKELGLL